MQGSLLCKLQNETKAVPRFIIYSLLFLVISKYKVRKSAAQDARATKAIAGRRVAEFEMSSVSYKEE